VTKSKRGTKGKVNYWLVKQEPDTYGWEHLVRDGGTMWDGVRNYQARNNLKAMKVGDRALFYHSGKQPEVVGIAEVTKAAYPDPTTTDDRWVVVDLKPVEALAHPVSLASIRANAALSDLPLLKQSQLSVMPVTAKQYKEIIRMGSKGKS
jgi:predicted RNA-binding protein with PUA-like domain